MRNEIEVKAPGRVCFFGDHQDYLGLPVIAASIDRYVYMRANPIEEKKFVLDLQDFSTRIDIDFQEDLSNLAPRDYFRSAMRVLKREGISWQQGYHIQIWGELPIQSGLSSSTAVVVAWIRLLVKLTQPIPSFSDEKIAQLSYAAEVLEFNEPGGIMDHYTIVLGGLLYIDTAKKTFKRLASPWKKVIIVDSGLKKQTIDVLNSAKTNALKALQIVQEKYPTFHLEQAKSKDFDHTAQSLPHQLRPYWSAAIHNHLITQKGFAELQKSKPDVSQINKWIDAHQKILQNDLKNTPEAMVEMMRVARVNGGQGIKIVGSGGGGCFIAFADNKTALDLVRTLKTKGVKDAFITQITQAADV